MIEQIIRYLIIALIIALAVLAYLAILIVPCGHVCGQPAQPPAAVHVDQAPGDSFADRLAWSWRYARHRRIASVVLPGGRVHLDRTFRAVFNTIPTNRHPGHLARGVRIVGNRTTIVWTGPRDAAMIEIPGARHLTIDGPLTLDGSETPGTIGVHFTAGWDYGQNGCHQVRLDQVDVRRAGVGYWIGDPVGPDHRDITFARCRARQVKTGWVAQGANVTAIHLIGCGAYTFDRGLYAIGVPGLAFELGEVTDPWRRPISADHHATEAWKRRQRTGDDGLTYSLGGSPSVWVHGFTAHSRTDGAVVFHSHAAQIVARDVRIEGPDCAAWESTGPTIKKENARLPSLLDGVSCASVGMNVDHRAGVPLTIRGGHYRGTVATGRAAITITGDPHIGHRTHDP